MFDKFFETWTENGEIILGFNNVILLWCIDRKTDLTVASRRGNDASLTEKLMHVLFLLEKNNSTEPIIFTSTSLSDLFMQTIGLDYSPADLFDLLLSNQGVKISKESLICLKLVFK